ncbi:protein apterous-like [Ctenocephalides felis]|uniref:protein apterous-like n=1 Tax=Ctenocephalides felis TaxID=7515 RepID=UPI000E6E409A|nr:protein apterous-like [Ctenocephalides felis]
MAPISSRELVMRARHLVFHVACFACATCRTPLTKGDQYGMRDSMVLCRLHYEASLSMLDSTMQPGHYHHHDQMVPLPYPSDPSPHPGPDSPILGGIGGIPPMMPSNERLAGAGTFFGGTNPQMGPGGVPAGGTVPRQKGRPRKRKPKDLEAMTAGLDLNTEYLDLAAFGPSGGSGSSRTKRMRTSFKHHQLRTMKSYFAINHNPDAKDLKQLSQKTGLPKRVLQVWFQNARAKWRRMMLKQESGGVASSVGGVDKSGNCSEAGDLDLDSYSAHSPTGSSSYHHHHHMMGGHSPQSID